MKFNQQFRDVAQNLAVASEALRVARESLRELRTAMRISDDGGQGPLHFYLDAEGKAVVAIVPKTDPINPKD